MSMSGYELNVNKTIISIIIEDSHYLNLIPPSQLFILVTLIRSLNNCRESSIIKALEDLAFRCVGTNTHRSKSKTGNKLKYVVRETGISRHNGGEI